MGAGLRGKHEPFLGQARDAAEAAQEDLEDIMKRESQMVTNAVNAGLYIRILGPAGCYYTLSESIVRGFCVREPYAWCDVDGAGFVSVSEVNNFATSRPEEELIMLAKFIATLFAAHLIG
jgi:hypothetical protein